MQARPSPLLEMKARSQHGPLYVRLVAKRKVLQIGDELDLDGAPVQAWIAILDAARECMRRSG